MNQVFKEVQERLIKELCLIEEQKFEKLEFYKTSSETAQKYFKLIQEILAAYNFSDKSEEIHFFREIQPSVVSEIIFYSTLLNLELQLNRLLTTKDKKQYCKLRLKEIQKWFEENKLVIGYYRLKHELFDDILFIRKSLNNSLPFVLDEFMYLCSQNNFTGFDFVIARYLAYERLLNQINTELRNLNSETAIHTSFTGVKNVNAIPWNSQKVDLVELASVLHCACYKNKSNVSLNDIVTQFAIVFNVQIDDPYSKNVNIKARTNPTKFIDFLKNSFLNDIDNDIK